MITKNILIVFVNGFTHACLPFRDYWIKNSANSLHEKDEFINGAQNYFKQDNSNIEISFVDGSCRKGSLLKYFGFSTAKQRKNLGINWAANFLKNHKIDYQDFEINFVTHSMGGAFSEGIVKVFIENGLNVKKIIHLSTADAYYVKISESTSKVKRIQLGVNRDFTIKRFSDPFSRGKQLMIPQVDIYGEIEAESHKMIPNVSPKDVLKYNYHAWTKWDAKVFDAVKELERYTHKDFSQRIKDYDKYIFNYSSLKLEDFDYTKIKS